MEQNALVAEINPVKHAWSKAQQKRIVVMSWCWLSEEWDMGQD